MLTLTMSKGWVVRQLDVNNAFMNEESQVDVYMVQPGRSLDIVKPHYVFKLRKDLMSLNKHQEYVL